MSSSVGISCRLVCVLVIAHVWMGGLRFTHAQTASYAVTVLRSISTKSLRQGPGIGTILMRFIPGSSTTSVSLSLSNLMSNSPFSLCFHTYGDLTTMDTQGTSIGALFPDANQARIESFTTPISATTWSSTFPVTGALLNGPQSRIGRSIALHNGLNCSGAILSQGVLGLQNNGSAPNAAAASTTLLPSTVGVCTFHGTRLDPSIDGTVQYLPSGRFSRVGATINQLIPNSVHGFHIHTYGDIRNDTAQFVGPHYSTGQIHDLPPNEPRHLGDMGNLQANNEGTVCSSQAFSNFQVIGTPRNFSIIGRSTLLHKTFDQGKSQQPAGLAGPFIAVCAIGIANPSTNFDELLCVDNPSTSAVVAIATVFLSLILGLIILGVIVECIRRRSEKDKAMKQAALRSEHSMRIPNDDEDRRSLHSRVDQHSGFTRLTQHSDSASAVGGGQLLDE